MRLQISTSCLAVEQGNLAHLARGTSERGRRECRGWALFFFLLGFGLFEAVDFGLFDNLDIVIGEGLVDFTEVIRAGDAIRKGFRDVVVGQVTLLLGQPEKIFDAIVELTRTRLANSARSMFHTVGALCSVGSNARGSTAAAAALGPEAQPGRLQKRLPGSIDQGIYGRKRLVDREGTVYDGCYSSLTVSIWRFA